VLPLARIFPGKWKFWHLAGKMEGNQISKGIRRKMCKLPGK
jgi:hypothetical protein